MREIPVKGGHIALVDEGDYEKVSAYKWYIKPCLNTNYAQARKSVNGKGVPFTMHRFIMDAPTGSMVDHVDGNGLNNQRSNLRFCTSSQNQRNRVSYGRTSQYRGVTFDKHSGAWRAIATIDGHPNNLGLYVFEVDAALAYDRFVSEHYGEFFRLNLPGLDDGRELTRYRDPNAKWHRTNFTKEEIVDMFRRYSEGETQPSISLRYGVSCSTVHSILSGKVEKYKKFIPESES